MKWQPPINCRVSLSLLYFRLLAIGIPWLLRRLSLLKILIWGFIFWKTSWVCGAILFWHGAGLSFFPLRWFVCNRFPAFHWDKMEYLCLGFSRKGVGRRFWWRHLVDSSRWLQGGKPRRRKAVPHVACFYRTGENMGDLPPLPLRECWQRALAGSFILWETRRSFPTRTWPLLPGLSTQEHFWTACFWPCQNGCSHVWLSFFSMEGCGFRLI